MTITSPSMMRTLRLTKEWKSRVRAIERRFLKCAVDQIYEDLLQYIPSDRTALRKSLRVDRIRGLPDGVTGYSIRSVASPVREVRDSKKDTVIYVAAKPHLMQRVPKATTILEEHGPWTSETLPYPPDLRTADVISRRVSRREVARVAKDRKRDLPMVRRLMKEAGIRYSELRTSTKGSGVLATPDVAFESLRLEFGLGGEPSKPHWRKAILRMAAQGGVSRLAKKNEFRKALSDLSFKRWKSWLKVTDLGISSSRATQYAPFEKRLGLHVRRS